MTESMSSGKRCFIWAINFLTPAAASTAFEPGNWYTAMMALGFPFNRLTIL